jgi:general secretion pathway protein L
MAKYVGIDIGSERVKVAVLKTAYRKLAIEALESVPIGEGTAAAALKEAYAKAVGTQGADGVAIALSGVRVSSHRLEIPKSAEKQLDEVLPFEIEALTPLEISETIIDHRLLPVKDTDPNLQVLAIIARQADVKERIDLVKEAIGVEPERVGAGAFVLAQLAPYLPGVADAGPIAVLDLGTKGSDLVILENGEPRFTRALALGTEGLPGTAPKLAREVRLSLAAFRAQGGAPPVHLFLCGGGAFVSGAESFLQGELEIPTKQVPLPTIELGEGIGSKAPELALYAKALALAAGFTGKGATFELRKGALAYERGFGWLKERVPVLVGLGAVIALSFLLSSITAIVAANKERTGLENALGSVTKEVFNESTTSADRANELVATQGAADEDPMPHADAFDVMVRLSEHIPQSMTHDIEELDVQKGHVVVHGVVSSVSDAQSIAASLSKNERCFDAVKITRTNQVVGGERQKYVLEFDLKCPEDVREKKKPNTSGGAASASSGGKP